MADRQQARAGDPGASFLDADELAAYFALRRAGDRLRRVVTHQLRAFDLSEVQFSALATLRHTATDMSMGDLAHALAVSRSGLTYQIAQLEARGLAQRAGSERDERSVIVRLTTAGRHVIDRALPHHVALVRESFLDLLDEHELGVVSEALGRVAQAPVAGGANPPD